MIKKKTGNKKILTTHDEFVAECVPDRADELGRMMEDSMKEAVEFYKLRCPIAGEVKTGATWYDVH